MQLALAGARDEDRGRPAAEDRVASPLLAALDALQQEPVRAVVDLAERRHGRVVVREHLAIDRHQLAGLGERVELGAGRDEHVRGATPPAWLLRVPAGLAPSGRATYALDTGAASSSRACRRVVSVTRSPASIRASSSMRPARSSSVTFATVRPPATCFETARW